MTSLTSIGALWWFTRKLDIHPAVKSLIGATVGMAALQVMVLIHGGSFHYQVLSFHYPLLFPGSMVIFIVVAGILGDINPSIICSCVTRNCTSGWGLNTPDVNDSAQSHFAEAVSISSQITASSCEDCLMISRELCSEN